jgi:molybdopterin molybdotransferase
MPTAAWRSSPTRVRAVLSSAVWGDGLIDNPPQQVIRRGDMVRFLPFSALLN